MIGYMHAGEFWSLDAGVSAGALDPDYEAPWLCDGDPSQPIRSTAGSDVYTITNPSGYVDTVVIGMHNLDGALVVVVGGDLAGSVVIPASRPNLIPHNGLLLVTPNPAVASVTLSISSNTNDIVIGEAILGASHELKVLVDPGAQEQPDDFRLESGGEAGFVPGYARKRIADTWQGSVLVTDDPDTYSDVMPLDDIKVWYESQQSGRYPSVLIVDSVIPDVRIGQMTYRLQTINKPRHWHADLTFVETPRTRW